MSTKDYRSYYIGKIKELVTSFDDSVDDSSRVSELEEYVKYLRKAIEQHHSGHYIAIYDVGPDDDFNRCYKMLGYMTEAEALGQLNKIVDEFGNGYYGQIREVTEKEWDDFYHLKYLTDISDRLEWLERYNDVSETVANDISAKIKELRKQLGLQNRWEYVVE